MSANKYTENDIDSLIHYQQLFDESPAPKYIFDLETFVFLAVNDAALEQYGYTREEFLTMKVTDIRFNDDEKTTPLRKLLAENPGTTYSDYGRWKHKRKNGEVFHVHVYAHATQFNGRSARFTMAINIDSRVQMEQELEAKNLEQQRILEKIEKDESNLRAIINNTTDLIWSIDKNYQIISANEPFYRRMELVTGKLIDRINHSDFPAEKQQQWIGFYTRGFNGESFKIIWYEQLLGIDYYQEISINPIREDDDNVLGVCCISRDITENYLYTKQIEQQNDQLRNIAWIQSHEVRAPLTDILGLVSLLREGVVTGQDQNNVIGLIGEAADKLDDVIAKIVKETHRDKPDAS